MVDSIFYYMQRYWYRYPTEVDIDPTIDNLVLLALQNNVYIHYGVFIIYTIDTNNDIIILYYCFDFQENLRQTLKAHRRFTKNRNVYIVDFKSTYKRNDIAEFDYAKSMWRFL